MSGNPYYDYSGNFIPGVLARAEVVASEFQLVQQGFADLSWQGSDTGAANAYVVTTQGAPFASGGTYANGQQLQFQALNANTGASTVNANGIGVVNILRPGGAALQSGDIGAGQWTYCIYNSGLGAFVLLGPTPFTALSTGTISSNPPTHKVGLVAAAGASTAAAPIDVTFAIDQSIAPTWTGLHTFNDGIAATAPISTVALAITAATNAVGVTVLGSALNYGLSVTGNATNGDSLGLIINAGTTSADIALIVKNQAGTQNFFVINGDGHGGLGPSNSNGISWTTAGGFNIAIPVSGIALTIGAVANAYGLKVNGSSTSGQSLGLWIVAGTTSADAPLLVQNSGASQTYFEIFGDGHGSLGPNLTNNLSWTTAGAFTISVPTGGVAFTVTAVAGAYALQVNSAGSGTEKGLLVAAGAAVGDVALLVENQAGSVVFLQIFGDGHGSIGPSATLGLSWNTSGGVAVAAPSSGAALIVTGAANSYTVSVTASSTSGQSLGELIKAGTTSADVALVVQNQAGSATFFEVFGDGHGTLGASTSLGAAWATTGELGISTPSTIGNLPGGFTQVGYMDIPQNHITANYTLALTDRGKSIYITGTTAAQTVTIPANSSVAFPVSTTIIIINISNQSWSVAITTDVLEWLPGTNTGTRTLAAGGMMTLYKDTATHWLAWGFAIT